MREELSKKKLVYLDVDIDEFQGTFAEWTAYWMNEVLKRQVKPSTWTSYESKFRNHILPVLGKIKLQELEKKHIQGFIHQLKMENYADNSIKNILSILKSNINYAVSHDFLVKNPCKNISISSKGKKAIRVLSIEEQKRLEAFALQEKGCSAVILGLATGMRIGEICGLQWSDIDFDNSVITVQRTLQRIPDPENLKKTKVICSTPKTTSSFRIIPLPKYLKRYLLSRVDMNTSAYVVSINGKFAEPRIINYRLKKLLEKAQLEPFSFHTLRHTFATRCVENGVDVTSLSKLLGHTSTKLTLDIYTDSLWEMRKEAMELISRNQFR